MVGCLLNAAQSGVNIESNGLFHVYSKLNAPPHTHTLLLRALPSTASQGSSCFLNLREQKQHNAGSWQPDGNDGVNGCNVLELKKLKLSSLSRIPLTALSEVFSFWIKRNISASSRILNWARSLKRMISFFLTHFQSPSSLQDWQPLDPKDAASCLLPPSVRCEPSLFLLFCFSFPAPCISLDAVVFPNVTLNK